MQKATLIHDRTYQGEKMYKAVNLSLINSPEKIEIEIDGKYQTFQLDFTKMNNQIGPKTGDAIFGKATNLSKNWADKSEKAISFLNLNGTADNSGNAKIIFWHTI